VLNEREKVLVIEDDPALGENLVELVQAASLQAERVTNSAEALLRVEQGDVAAVLFDLRLSDGSGGPFVRGLRARSASTCAILVTGDATVETAAAAVSEGAFAYILKPFSPQALIDTVSRAVEQARLLREQERLRLELERSERRYREIIEAVPAFVMALDNQSRIVLWNRRLEEATGFSRDQMLGKPGQDLIAEDSARLPRARGANRNTDGETELRVRWGRADLDRGPDFPATYAIGIDVTDEQAMLRRTLRAERLAAVGTLAAGLAHEIRNPLNAAHLQLTLLERRLEKQAVDRSTLDPVIHVIQSEIQRLERLVNEFLAFARPRQLDLRPTAVDEICRGVIELVRPEAEGAGVTIEMEIAANLPAVPADSERLRQVILNLVRNAIEAMPGGGTLSIGAFFDADALTVEIGDTGQGIAEDEQVFDAFFTTKAEGTGLGLSLVHRIVTDHGGEISFTSRPGNTRFVFTLPLR
jgi:PAS domain S-box-containing protein